MYVEGNRGATMKICIIPIMWILCILLPALAIADQVNLNYSECRNYVIFNVTDNSTSNLTICAPPFNVPPAVSRTLNWNETNTTNNFTATCKAWDNSSCPPAPSCKVNQRIQFAFLDMGVPEVLNYTNADLNLTVLNTPKPNASSNISLGPGQSQVFDFQDLRNLSGVTVSCQVQSNCSALTGLENVRLNGTFAYHYFNAKTNTTFDCPAYPYINNIYNLVAPQRLDLQAYKASFICSCKTSDVGRIDRDLNITCNQNDRIRFDPQNLTITIEKCPSANYSFENCEAFFNETSLANSSMGIMLSANVLASSDCTINDIVNGRATQCLNDSFNTRDAKYEGSQAALSTCKNDTSTQKDRADSCQSGQNLLLIAIFAIGIVAFLTVVISVALQVYSRSRKPR